MNSTREIVGLVGAVVWFLVNDVAGGIAGLFAGWVAMAGVEPVLGGLSGGVLLLSVPLGLFAGGLLGAASLGWMAAFRLDDTRPAMAGR